MRFPTINKRTRQGVVIPELAGGINLRDSVSMVADNQLTDAVNVWFCDGVLKTRPGIGAVKQNSLTVDKPQTFSDFSRYRKTHNISQIKENKTYCLASENWDFLGRVSSESNYYSVRAVICFFWIGEGESQIQQIPVIVVDDVNLQGEYFVVQHQDILYCYLSNGSIFSYKDGDNEWKALTNDDIYAPLIATHCMPQFGLCASIASAIGTGVQFEGYNLIGNRYRMIYSNCNPELISSTDGLAMYYWMPYSCKDFKDEEKIIVKHTESDGTVYEHYVSCNGNIHLEESIDPGDGLLLYVTSRNITFVVVGEDTLTTKQWFKKDFLEDSIEIIAPCPNSEKNLKKIFDMTHTEWFGGASAGINGGTRLFLGGNTNADEHNLVVWSGLNEPLYFSENNYFYVGDSSQAVTALKRQDNMLVVFKEASTYYTYYNQNTDITADDLINQSVVDYSASSVYFPLVQINACIGCDCPDTVQLCRNRLVWVHSSGKVYTLVSNNQYSECTIYEVGAMTERRLKMEEGLKKAVSADWQDHYLILCGDRMYVMDYNSSGYQYAYSYQKNEDANIRIPWYYWELPKEFKNCCIIPFVNTLNLFMMSEKAYDAVINVGFLSSEYTFDNGSPIHTEIQTKLFDFGASGYRKNVDTVLLSLGNNGGDPITVAFVTDCGTEYDEITLDGDETQSYTAGYIRALSLAPCIRSVVRFGVRLSCDGVLAVDGITLNYRILGGAR